MKSNSPENPPQKLQFWIVWISLLVGLPVMQSQIVGGWPTGEDQGEVSQGLLIITVAGVIASTIVRWFILPRMKNAQSLLTAMVVGLALAEATGLLGMFLIGDRFPETQQTTFILSLLGMLQFIPTYADAFTKDSHR